MHFCSQCHNMYYVKISQHNENKLIYYCRKCGHEDTIITEDNICVSKTYLKQTTQKFRILSMNSPNSTQLFQE